VLRCASSAQLGTPIAYRKRDGLKIADVRLDDIVVDDLARTLAPDAERIVRRCPSTYASSSSRARTIRCWKLIAPGSPTLGSTLAWT
jgi:hypothetical protein